jgi:hypothetical protein
VSFHALSRTLIPETALLQRSEFQERKLHKGDILTLRQQRRLGELREDLELMIKSELMGRFAHFETRMEQELAAVAERLGALEGRGSVSAGVVVVSSLRNDE